MSSIDEERLRALAGQAADELAEHGVVVIERFLPEQTTAELRNEASRLREQKAFRRAGIGAGGDLRTREDIRGDEIFWIEADTKSAPLRDALAVFEMLRVTLNRELFLGLQDFECHLARYCAGAGYQRHYDQLRGDERRQLTVTLYLNDNWRREDGGTLRIYLDEYDEARTLDVLPAAGTLVAFRSERFAHEVLACTRERFSLTGWFRRR